VRTPSLIVAADGNLKVPVLPMSIGLIGICVTVLGVRPAQSLGHFPATGEGMVLAVLPVYGAGINATSLRSARAGLELK
jgi:hypothetical protein